VKNFIDESQPEILKGYTE